MIRKLLIANRGEIACRIIRTARQMGIATVAVYSEADSNALHVAMADEAVLLGASPATESYLHIEKIIAAMQRTTADAVHPGYGFLAENADFARAVTEAGLTFVGPASDVIAAMGNKREAKQMLSGVPYIPGYTGDDQSDEAFISAAYDIGYPVMVKAAAGGGGKGMRLAHSADTLPDELAAARREAQQAFGNGVLMLEKALSRPRHIEVQIIADTHSHVIALGERECSIQRRHQKIIEEAPAPGLSAEQRYQIHQTAVNIAKQLNYTSAGTVEFLMDSNDNMYFIEMNTRLQVEHPVTEAIYAVDIVRWQLEIAQGALLSDLLPPFVSPESFNFAPDGHAIEARIYAEDPANDFLPVTGEVLHWQEPSGVRVDAGVRSGDTVSTHYDPMLAKVIAHGASRTDALRRLDYALSRLQFLGMRNNVAFLRRVLTHPDHLSGAIHTQFIDDHPDLLTDETSPPPIVLAAAVLHKRGRGVHWRNNPNQPQTHTFTHNNTAHTLQLAQHRDGTLTLYLHDSPHRLDINQIADNQYTLTLDGHRQTVTVISADAVHHWLHTPHGTWHLQWKSPLPLPGEVADVRGSLRAPMPGQVIDILVEIGQQVEAGTTLMILEAMKMEHRITAPQSGIIETLHYTTGDTVQADDMLLTLTDEAAD